MPEGPEGEKRPAGVTAKITRITTGEKPDDRRDLPALSPAAQLGKLGGAARARILTAEQRSEIARKAAAKRWGKG